MFDACLWYVLVLPSPSPLPPSSVLICNFHHDDAQLSPSSASSTPPPTFFISHEVRRYGGFVEEFFKAEVESGRLGSPVMMELLR
jgi:hypothetical protein